MIYKVRSGDTLNAIASSHQVTLEQIMQANSDISDPNLIYPDQKVFIPKNSISANTLNDTNKGNSANKQSQEDQEAQVGETVQPCSQTEDEEEEVETTSIRVSIFFDGTANNRTNVQHRLDNSETYKSWRAPMGSGSYANDFSNISRLEKILTDSNGAEHSFSIYTEGIGTQNSKRDVIKGLAEGKGSTGVTGKVEAGIKRLIDDVEKLGIPKETVIDFVEVDAFGFSRGAAAARYFVWAVDNHDTLAIVQSLSAKGYTVNELRVNFVGLYDTVASYGLLHYDDTDQLKLDKMQKAKQVIQLAAAEEHRKNFRLTNLKSCKGNGKEIFLPGVHSDVGGGYVDNADEVDLQVLDLDEWTTDSTRQRFADEKAWLIRKGWYKEDEFEEVNWWNELKVNRYNISNKYDRIPLKIMATFATENGINFKSALLKTKHRVPSALASIDTKLTEYAASAGNSSSKIEDWWNEETLEFQNLRHDYLHFSASYGGANQPRIVDKKRERKINDG